MKQDPSVLKPILPKNGFLLDTDVLINILKRIPGYSAFFHLPPTRLSYASVSKKELYSKRGLTKSEAMAIAELLAKMRKIDPDSRILRCYDSLLRKYRHKNLLKADALIAATAWAKGLILITNNITDFSFIAEIQVSSPTNLINQQIKNFQ